jgi:undecaprenyl-diphosphatase
MSHLFSADTALRAWLASHHAPWLDWVMVTASSVGARGRIWLALAVVLLSFRPRRARGVWQTALAIGLAGLVTDGVLKPSFQRARPFATFVETRVIAPRPDTHSFPSGHAATAFAGGFALARIWPEMRGALWALACLIAFSRVYVGVHYPLDVLAGALVGMAAAAFVIGGTVWPDVARAGRTQPPLTS